MPAAKRSSPYADAWSVGDKCKIVSSAIKEVSDLRGSVKDMLCASLSASMGGMKESRAPQCGRVAEMIGQVLSTYQATLTAAVAEKEKALEELKPAKVTRDDVCNAAMAKVKETEALLEAATAAVTGAEKTLKEASASLASKLKIQKTGDKEIETLIAKKEKLAAGHAESFVPLAEGTAPEAEVKKLLKTLMSLTSSFSFDPSLMTAVSTVLTKSKEARTEFDSTCTAQVEEAFQAALASFAAKIQEATPGKAERAGVVDAATAQKGAAEQALTVAQEELAAVKKTLSENKAAVREAKKSLADFYPDLQAAGEAFDEAKAKLADFQEGALAAYEALKERNEEWMPPVKAPRKSYYETIDGQKCDRGMLDACRAAVVGQGDGRISVEDAKAVFEKIADGGKVTQNERWTLRFCMSAFLWTDAAHDWIVEELKKVPQEDAPSPSKSKGTGYYETVDGMKLDRAMIDVCRESIVGQGDGRISHADAEKVWAKAIDGGKVTDAEKWTLRYCMCTFNWTRAAHDFVIEELKKLE